MPDWKSRKMSIEQNQKKNEAKKVSSTMIKMTLDFRTFVSRSLTRVQI